MSDQDALNSMLTDIPSWSHEWGMVKKAVSLRMTNKKNPFILVHYFPGNPLTTEVRQQC